MTRPAALVALLILGAANSAQAQKPDERAASIAKLISQAQTGRAVLGQEAGRALLAATGSTPAGFAALGKDLVEVSGYFELPALRAKLWTALNDANFPWRPAAAIGLSAKPLGAEFSRFDDLLADPLSSVRNAAVKALGDLAATDRKHALRAHLEREEGGRVRRTVAAQLDSWGERWALWYLVSDLQRMDEFFGQPTGRISRLAAMRLLRKSLGQDFGFKPVEDPSTPTNRTALKLLMKAVQARRRPGPDSAASRAPRTGLCERAPRPRTAFLPPWRALPALDSQRSVTRRPRNPGRGSARYRHGRRSLFRRLGKLHRARR